jgi:hypothetical protein
MADPTDEWRNQIDTDFRHMGERLVGVEAGISALSRSFDKFSHSFESTVARQQELQKTRWPLVLGVLTLVLVVISGFMSGYLRDLNRIEDDVLKIQAHRISEEDPVQNARIDDNSAEVTGIRLNEHKILTDNAAIMMQLEEWEHIKNQGVNHMGDGHPERTEQMLDHNKLMLRDHALHVENRLIREMERVDRRLLGLEQQEHSEHAGP